MSEHTYEWTFRLSPTPILIIDVNSGFTVAAINTACEILLNKTDTEVKGKGLTDVFFSAENDHQSILQEHLQKVCFDNQPHQIKELKFITDGRADETKVRYLNILFTPSITAKGALLHIIVTIIDITEIVTARKTESTIREELTYKEKFLSETQRVARSGSFEADLMNNRMIWSDVMKEIHEVEPDYEPTLESTLAFYSTEKQRMEMTELAAAAVANNSAFDIEVEIITAKGNVRTLHCSGKAEQVNGEPARVYGTAQDITEEKKVAVALKDSRNKYQDLVEAVDGIVWEADAQTFTFTFVSEQVYSMLGYTATQWLSEPNFWIDHIHKDDRESAINFCKQQIQNLRSHTFDYRMIRADGNVVWIKDIVTVLCEDGQPKLLRGILVDITETKQLAELDHLEKEVLELNSMQNTGLEEVLNAYVNGIEGLFPNMRFSVLKVQNNKLHKWSAPSLPDVYIDSINGMDIGPEAGSCGTAAYLKETVIVSDIETDPKWAKYKHLALPHNLRACWSYPIIDAKGNVIAAFAVYYNTVKSPGPEELNIIDRSSAILKVILENRIFADTIKEVNMLITQGQELANFGNWQWDIVANKVTWSDVLYNIYGVTRDAFKATFEGYLTMLHPDDKERVQQLITGVVQSGEDTVFDERIIRPDGEVRHLKSWGRVIMDENGRPSKMIGACLDITKAIESEAKMKEIAWMQSHVVRSPLANLMGLVNLFKETPPGAFQTELVNDIQKTAYTLDSIIRDISNKTGRS